MSEVPINLGVIPPDQLYVKYVERMTKEDPNDPFWDEPICPSPGCNCECYVDRSDIDHGCLKCSAAWESYKRLTPEEIRLAFGEEIEELGRHLNG